jgi:hypothetical protein
VPLILTITGGGGDGWPSTIVLAGATCEFNILINIAKRNQLNLTVRFCNIY